jgi:hypothetical protein
MTCLSFVFYEYESCSLTLREEHRIRVFKNRVTRRIFGPERGSGRKLQKIAFACFNYE